jgi:hypothetical protein
MVETGVKISEASYMNVARLTIVDVAVSVHGHDPHFDNPRLQHPQFLGGRI